MNNTLSFMSANYVAREVGYRMTEGWMQGDRAAQEHFRPLETFRERFGALLRAVRSLGFEAIDLWSAHLHWSWATDEHLKIARELLAEERLVVPTLAGDAGTEPAEFRRACETARAVGAGAIAGGTPLLKTRRADVVAMLRDFGLRFGVENHPEKTPEELLARIGDTADGLVGAAVDTGWFGTQGCAAPPALERLRGHLVAVHLKDVKARRVRPSGYALIDAGHETCALGDGIVDVPGCVKTLRAIAYSGPIAIEHEPEHYNPDEECRESLRRVRAWCAAI